MKTNFDFSNLCPHLGPQFNSYDFFILPDGGADDQKTLIIGKELTQVIIQMGEDIQKDNKRARFPQELWVFAYEPSLSYILFI